MPLTTPDTAAPSLTRDATLCAHLKRDFPHLDRAKLPRDCMDGDRLVAHLARAHDLTRAEAADTLAHWSRRRSPG